MIVNMKQGQEDLRSMVCGMFLPLYTSKGTA